MDLTIHASFLPHTDPEASLAFYRDTLGFAVREVLADGPLRWITVGPVGQPDTALVLQPPAVGPGVTRAERRMIVEMMAKGTYAGVVLAAVDVVGVFGRLEAGGVEVVQAPGEQPWGGWGCAVRDPAGNLIRISQRR
jgi:catechol 2,3-dioxygenase-like lactoylglutathione lyase family enzyme